MASLFFLFILLCVAIGIFELYTAFVAATLCEAIQSIIIAVALSFSPVIFWSLIKDMIVTSKTPEEQNQTEGK